MCYHGNQEIPIKEKEENKESTFKDRGNPTYAGFQSKSTASSLKWNPWLQGYVHTVR